MRIGIFDPYLDDLGGGEKYMMTIAECLSQNHDVSLFWENNEDIEALKKRFSINLDRIKRTQNIFSSKTSLIKRLAESKKYDVLIVLSDGSIPVVLSKKLFLHIQQPLAKSEVTTWKGGIKLKRVNKIFYNSIFTKACNTKLFGKVKTEIIYPPVALYAQKTPKQNIILHVGRFRTANVVSNDFKKQQFMVETFKQMVDKGFKEWKLVIATSIHDENDGKFQAMLKSASRYPIEFAVNKTNKELWEIYNKAKIYWHASGFGEDLQLRPHLAEHFGISTVEAMGAGVVPVVINAGGQKEIVRDGANGLLWNTLEELQTKTIELTKNQKMWEHLSETAQKDAKEYSKEIFCKKVNDLLI